MNRKGISLIELLVVLALIGIATSVAIGYSIKNQPRWSLRSDARDITTTIHQIKQQAAKENRLVRFELFGQYSGKAGFNVYFFNRQTQNWQKVKTLTFGEKTDWRKIPNDYNDFVIAPSGIILRTDNFSMAGAQMISLIAPYNAPATRQNTIVITIYPYGGINVKRIFK